MPLEFINDTLSDFIKNTNIDTEESIIHIVCFPAISLKKTNKKDAVYVTELYNKYEKANYYDDHHIGNRAKAGTIKSIYYGGGNSGIINFFCKVYASDTTGYMNDSQVSRIKYFNMCLTQVCKSARITELHMQLPALDTDNIQGYTQSLNDFISTYKLENGTEPKIVIHLNGVKEPENKEPLNTRKKQLKNNTIEQIPETPVYKLANFSEEHLFNDTESALYEIDFTIKAQPVITNNSIILSHFPTDNRWMYIMNDSKINRMAAVLDKNIGSIIGTDNVFPRINDIFNAFTYSKTEPKIVILGQDPYNGPKQDHGLAFSVTRKFKTPPSLKNIYKALLNDESVTFTEPTHGCLTEWAEQGVILFNLSLTVEKSKPLSHIKHWESFTNRLIELISHNNSKIVFMLWGAKAKAKKKLIKLNGHLVLEYCHPSPKVIDNKFPTECDHFSKANKFLRKAGKQPIDWQIN
uniref:Uracil-DNA glycosylase-like domain-containing protein n=1 Tax=viral metagenome TaxID=1070528 RepID=A0A6C0J5L2_9ZZZZ